MDFTSTSSPFLADTSCLLCSCHPACLEREIYSRLSTPDAFKGLTIHTEELFEVLSHLASRSLTIVIVCPSQFTTSTITKSLLPSLGTRLHRRIPRRFPNSARYNFRTEPRASHGRESFNSLNLTHSVVHRSYEFIRL